MEISTTIYNYIKSNNGLCKVFTAPLDVILKNDNEDFEESSNVVILDILVICDKNKLNDAGCIGSPDMIIEIISPENPSHDYVTKLKLYQKYKVKEYWIVVLLRKLVMYIHSMINSMMNLIFIPLMIK